MHVPARGTRWKVIYDGISSSLIAIISVLRGLLLLLSGRPRTPLRGLCIAAFDMLHVIRNGKRLTMHKLKTLAALLDFGASANAAFDLKEGYQYERRVTLLLLEEAGISLLLEEYRRRLSRLEGERPLSGGGRSQFQNVMVYREAVVRLSLGMIATAACIKSSIDEAIEATDGDLNLLYRIVMQCQIIDDALDYSQDRSAGLPSFLTACKSLTDAIELTQRAAHGYAESRFKADAAPIFPLQVALVSVSMCTKLIMLKFPWKARTNHLQLGHSQP